jgi:hypothetical protein
MQGDTQLLKDPNLVISITEKLPDCAMHVSGNTETMDRISIDE